MTKYGRDVVIRPLSSERVVAEITQHALEKGYTIEQASNSVIVHDNAAAMSECIKAIRELEAGNSEYACIEIYTGPNAALSRMNIAHFRTKDNIR